jgi:thiamine-monophosphate kinase
MHEFELIKHYFAEQTSHRPDVIRGIGDDAAVVQPPAGKSLAITTDTLVSGIHFLPDAHSIDVGYKSLAVNLSDLAAMGATPAWVTLALTLPDADEPWIQGFCDGFFTLANRYEVQLIGGDMTKGPLSITVQATGFLPDNKALLRSTAKAGDLIYVTGTLGDAGLALGVLQNKYQLPPEHKIEILNRLLRPEPRIATGRAILGLANAAIDISDGLAADLGHLIAASKVGANINLSQLPLSVPLANALPVDQAYELALTAGDDYELCFTVPPNHQPALEKALADLPCRFTCIGTITSDTGLKLHDEHNQPYQGRLNGYKHF